MFTIIWHTLETLIIWLTQYEWYITWLRAVLKVSTCLTSLLMFDWHLRGTWILPPILNRNAQGIAFEECCTNRNTIIFTLLFFPYSDIYVYNTAWNTYSVKLIRREHVFHSTDIIRFYYISFNIHDLITPFHWAILPLCTVFLCDIFAYCPYDLIHQVTVRVGLYETNTTWFIRAIWNTTSPRYLTHTLIASTPGKVLCHIIHLNI